MLQSRNARSIAVLGATMLLTITLTAGLRMSGVHLPFAVRLAIGVPVMAAGIWATCAYWRTVDEAAREAQKWAWFWGGSFGLVVGFVMVSLLAFAPWELLPPGRSPRTLLFYGAGVMMLSQTIGFLAAWAYWWARRR